MQKIYAHLRRRCKDEKVSFFDKKDMKKRREHIAHKKNLLSQSC